MTDNAELLVKLMEEVWNTGDVAAVDRFLAEQYSIHSDPGDPWDGQTLSREGSKNRLTTSGAPFPTCVSIWAISSPREIASR